MERTTSEPGTRPRWGLDEEAVRTVIESWASAVRARDIGGVLRRHAQDMTMFDVVGPLRLTGREAYARTWVDYFFPWHGGNGRFDLKDLDLFVGEQVAFATGLIECAGTENGHRVEFTLRLTVGLTHGADGWTIVHEHHSEPLPFDRSSIGDGRK